jgi:hypothetical protein
MWRERIQRKSFPSSNEWGIPDLPYIPISASIPDEIVVYGERLKEPGSLGIHFFTYDFHFNTVWTQPKKGLKVILKYKCAFTPDFSLYSTTPRAEQIWNTYRNRWVGAYWASQGAVVIPTVGWSDEQSYTYVFCGIPKNSVVAISTVGIQRSSKARSTFESGFTAMLDALHPNRILCYGKSLPHMETMNNIFYYPQYWEQKQPKADEDLPFEPTDIINF